MKAAGRPAAFIVDWPRQARPLPLLAATSAATFGILATVTYALRKLIAFVFLGGMFWFIYQDLDNLDKPWFMHALGLITISFAFFWLIIPMAALR